MKAFALSFFVLCCAACTKHTEQTVVARVINDSGHAPGAVLVEIENPSVNLSFICDDQNPMPAGQGYNCRNGAYILNLDGSLRAPGTRITFSKWKDMGRAGLWSSTYAPNDLKVFNAKKL